MPHFSSWKKKEFVAKMRIWADSNSVLYLGHVAKNLGRMITESERELGTVRPLKKLVRGVYIDSNIYKSAIAMNIEYSLKTLGKIEESNSIKAILNIALETWLKKL
ncbi:hypothetical protein NUACC26_002170 [Scytonema sp. NUACC26]